MIKHYIHDTSHICYILLLNHELMGHMGLIKHSTAGPQRCIWGFTGMVDDSRPPGKGTPLLWQGRGLGELREGPWFWLRWGNFPGTGGSFGHF